MSNSSNYTKDVVVFFDGLYKEYIINAENGHGTVFFIEADNKADAMEKISKATLISGKKNSYKYNK